MTPSTYHWSITLSTEGRQWVDREEAEALIAHLRDCQRELAAIARNAERRLMGLG